MSTEAKIFELLKQRDPMKRGQASSFSTGGNLQCSVGFISGFGPYDFLSTMVKGILPSAWNVGRYGPLFKDEYPAIWLFTMTSTQLNNKHNQDLITVLNAVDMYEYHHKAHGNNMHLFLAQKQYFNLEYMYDLIEQYLKEEGSIK